MRDFAEEFANSTPPEGTHFQLRLVWVEDKKFNNIEFIRLKCVLQTDTQRIKALLSATRDVYDENKQAIDAEMITITIWRAKSSTVGLPKQGQNFTMKRATKCGLFNNEIIQFTTTLKNIQLL